MYVSKKNGDCFTLLKKLYCVLYNLSYTPIKVIMAFKWNLWYTFVLEFISFFLVRVFVSPKKKKNVESMEVG